MKINIKNIIAGGAVATMLFGFSSCNDYLDITQEQTLPATSIDYSQTENMYEPVSGCYATMRNNMMHWVVNLLTVIRDRDVWSGRVDDQADLIQINDYVYNNSSFWGINEYWRVYYQMVRACNEALVNLDSYAEYITNENDMALYRSYCGEVRILRAIAYYYLVQFFGNVPIIFDNSQTDATPYTREAVYEYCLRDLSYAMQYTPKVRPNQMAHVGAYSAYTAEMLAAKIYLMMAGFQNNNEYYTQVMNLTNDIINSNLFELYDDYYQLFKLPGRLCNESLAECQVTDFGSGEGDYIGVDLYFVVGGPSISNPDTTPDGAGGWNFIGYYDSFYNWALERGESIRATTSFLLGGTTTPSGDYVNEPGNPQNTNNWNGKFYLPLNQFTPGRTDYGVGNNVRLFRYSEVLLMNAEAKVRLGQNGDTPFNLVRERADMPAITNVNIDQILDERRMELCCEWGNRYADLIRTGLASTVLGPFGWTAEKTYFAIPATQIDLAESLKNEPISTLPD